MEPIEPDFDKDAIKETPKTSKFDFRSSKRNSMFSP